ncbi:DUF5977 domain-containing protein [Chitinophaga agri]|uniref:PA14 domain-containing protein n=1 Tax=Chitinophaga agri TaxID=2703787 RepID=A0A6B9ZC74_9BACT|nr:DUF5977 domain-containing protein [Chitinophaga agri]QHS58193.1 hypothetical protein GWR21_00860 [Chitinophaga agri]
MVLELSAKNKRAGAYLLLALLYFETIIPSYALAAARSPAVYHYAKAARPANTFINNAPVSVVAPERSAEREKSVRKAGAFIGGPTQPEMQAFASVNNANMVDLFTGDFSYSIPLLDVGGYPIAIGYNSGISMDQEASWVGLGWNINPGTITRNMRGLPDDFNGTEDTIQKVASVKENRTVGGSVGLDVELVGFPRPETLGDSVKAGFGVGGTLGIFYNNYRGLGMETGVNASVKAGSASMGELSGGLSITNNSQQGASLHSTLSYSMSGASAQKYSGFAGNVSIGSTYSSRSGLKALSLSAGVQQYKIDDKNLQYAANGGLNRMTPTATISFAYPSYLPEITLPYSSAATSVTLKTGGEKKVLHPNFSVQGYASIQSIVDADKRMSIPAYGYLNYQHAGANTSVLLDFNRERDMPYREKPEIPNIGIPSYTYDVFSMSGEGTGGMFRAYRGDIGYVFDHAMRTKDMSQSASLDLGAGDLVHGGIDLNYLRATTTTGPWLERNPLKDNVSFSSPDKLYEAAYFRNPGEMTINDAAFYENIGGDDVVAVNLEQSGISSPDIHTTNIFNRYRNQRYVGKQTASPRNFRRGPRDKRTQVISYLTAQEADHAGLSRFIENYKEGVFTINNCAASFPDSLGDMGSGWIGEYYAGDLERFLFRRSDPQIAFSYKELFNVNIPKDANLDRFDHSFSARWRGRLKAPVTGKYTFITKSDDGVRFYMNDSLLIDHWGGHPPTDDSVSVNLIAEELYNVRLEYKQEKERAVMTLSWRYGGLPVALIPTRNLFYMPEKDTFVSANGGLVREKRINDFRKKTHISEIDVLNADGRRYIYGIPVYNLEQKEVTFAVKKTDTSSATGLVSYVPGQDNTVENKNGIDHYFSSERIPAYAHSFLLTGILSPDYQDLTGDGISADDPGDAIKFNYTKTASIRNSYKWRIPVAANQANYSEGLKTDDRDDKGSYVSGEKELWYLHTIESKNMIATFKLSTRKDLPAVDENGVRLADDRTRKLDEINLYTKAEFSRSKHPRPVKTVHFEYSYELCQGASGNPADTTTGRLTLKKIWFTYNGNDKGVRNPYIFSYHQNNPSYRSNGSDRWGTYKDPLQNPGSTKENVLTNADYPYALQDSAMAARNAAAWTLDSLVLPSGGRMKIVYESDDYAYVQNKRAAQLFNIAGFSARAPSSLNDLSPELYGLVDYLYVAVNVPYAVSSNEEVYNRYLQDMDKLYCRLSVQMPGDKFGKGNEYVSCYATVDPGNFGFFNNGKTIWLRLKAIDPAARMNTARSVYSPLAQSALQFLRLNLGSKAYPGSDMGDDIDVVDAVKVLVSQADNLNNMILTFDVAARTKHWARKVDLSRSFVRLNNPYYKKYGGGLRVKKVLIHDHWDKMTGQRESLYGQEYQYTTVKEINGKKELISSGVAAYEPIIGGEENPWKVPVEYNMQVSSLVPVDRGYTELPYGEGFFPSASVGYSRVRVRTIHGDKRRSANGYEETCFYTGYDFPTLTDITNLGDSKKKFKPLLSNLLRINARHFLGLSQGFKVELNDMTGKVKSQASYGEADPEKPITYLEYFYKVDDTRTLNKHLNNNVKVMAPNGQVSQSAMIGKDMELMLDMREQHSTTLGYSPNINGELFKFAWPPVLLIPMLLNLMQREETIYRSVAATKIITRHGIIDSVLAIDKGSRVTTKNLLYDAETGAVLLTSTQNEFDDPVYSFSYPAAWAYDGMGGAYRNIGLVMDHLTLKDGRITAGLKDSVNFYFAPGDEIMVYSHQKTGGSGTAPEIATFPANTFMYTVDANAAAGGTPDLYFVDRDGIPFTGNDVALKIVRSGRRNISSSVGGVVCLKNPLGSDNKFVLDSTKQIISASAVAYRQFWKVRDKKDQAQTDVCVTVPYSEYVGRNGDCGIRYYGNVAKSRSFRKNDCGTGTGSLVTYKVEPNRYSSTISQLVADSLAQADVDSFGQAYANLQGTCSYTYRNSADSVTVLLHACQGDAIPLPYTYTVPARTFASTVSQQAADALARQRLIDSAQVVANREGRCYYYNDTTGLLAYPVCETGIAPSGVWVQIPAGIDTSMISKAAANAKAKARYWAYAQAKANELGECPPCNVFYGKKPDAGDLGVFAIYITDTRTGQMVFMKSFSDPTDADLSKCTGLPSGTYSARIAINHGTDSLFVTVNGTERRVLEGDGETWLFNLAGAGLTMSFLFSDQPVKVYSNAAYTGSYLKTDCPEGYTGTRVDYTVAAGIYTSTKSQLYVDSLAKAYADAHGPEHANLNGSCNPMGTNVSIRQQENSPAPAAYNVVIRNVSDNSVVLTLNYLTLDGNLPLFRTIPFGSYIVEINAQTPGMNATVGGVQKMVSANSPQTWRVELPIDITVWGL